MVKQLVQSILIYVVIVSVLKGLISNPKYSSYFQFFSGMIMILLMLSPILSVLHFENDWYALLEENILQMDLENIEGEMEIADDRFADMVRLEYEETVKKQVEVLAQENGLEVQETEVELEQTEEGLEITKLAMTTDKTEDIAVETVQLNDSGQIKQEDDSKKAKKLRSQICNYFVIGEDKVHIWK